MINLPTDTYYRGYRLSQVGAVTYIFKDADLIDTLLTVHAKATIDEWHNAP